MTRIQNLTNRMVSIRGNSGQTWHLPPADSLELMGVEVEENNKITKLVASGVLAVHDEESVELVSTEHEQEGRQ